MNNEQLLCLLNAAACMLQLKLYKQCLENCTEALELTNGYFVAQVSRHYFVEQKNIDIDITMA